MDNNCGNAQPTDRPSKWLSAARKNTMAVQRTASASALRRGERKLLVRSSETRRYRFAAAKATPRVVGSVKNGATVAFVISTAASVAVPARRRWTGEMGVTRAKGARADAAETATVKHAAVVASGVRTASRFDLTALLGPREVNVESHSSRAFCRRPDSDDGNPSREVFRRGKVCLLESRSALGGESPSKKCRFCVRLICSAPDSASPPYSLGSGEDRELGVEGLVGEDASDSELAKAECSPYENENGRSSPARSGEGGAVVSSSPGKAPPEYRRATAPARRDHPSASRTACTRRRARVWNDCSTRSRHPGACLAVQLASSPQVRSASSPCESSYSSRVPYAESVPYPEPAVVVLARLLELALAPGAIPSRCAAPRRGCSNSSSIVLGDRTLLRLPNDADRGRSAP